MRTLATFWHGPPLSRLDQAGLLSFSRLGFEVELYSFDPIRNLPSEIKQRDAASIVDREFLTAFVIGGRPSLSHFSDLFRYCLFHKVDAAWIDTDLICLQDFHISSSGHFLTKEAPDRLNGAILRLDRAACDLEALIETTKRYGRQRDFPWGSTGPRLITRMLGPEALSQALPIDRFYPIDWNDWWMPFLPAYADRCQERCSTSLALHLWNNIIDKAGVWKDLAPPAGSYLSQQLSKSDLVDHFANVMPEHVMQTLVANYSAIQSGEAMSINMMARSITRRVATRLRSRLV